MELLYVAGVTGVGTAVILCPACRDELQALGYMEDATVTLAGHIWTNTQCQRCAAYGD